MHTLYPSGSGAGETGKAVSPQALREKDFKFVILSSLSREKYSRAEVSAN